MLFIYSFYVFQEDEEIQIIKNYVILHEYT